jgi:vacuolar-type H+-ATPase subunit E/Vma4
MYKSHSLLLFIVFFFSFSLPIHASSLQAYKDYIYEFDTYRTKNAEFLVAKNEFDKFKSLTSETAALEKSKIMLSQRNQLLRTYLLLLNEKLNETKGMPTTDRNLYQTLIANEVTFLQKQVSLVTSIGSIQDASNVSRELESHYGVLQASMRQTIIGISVGVLLELKSQFDSTLGRTKTLINTNRGVFLPQKQSTIDRWLLQIDNKISLFSQKIDEILRLNAKFQNSNTTSELDRTFQEEKGHILEAKQYLVEAESFIKEILTTLKYQN